MKASCAVRNPMTQMTRLFAAASTQPSQCLLPTRIVEKIVSTQDRQSSRNTSESISSFISVIFPRIEVLVFISRRRWRNLGNLKYSEFVMASIATARTSQLATTLPGTQALDRSLARRRSDEDVAFRHLLQIIPNGLVNHLHLLDFTYDIPHTRPTVAQRFDRVVRRSPLCNHGSFNLSVNRLLRSMFGITWKS